MGVPEWTLVVYVAQTIVFAATLLGILLQLRELRENLRHSARLATLQYIQDMNKSLIDKPYINQQMHKNNRVFMSFNQEQREFYNYITLSVVYYEWQFLLQKSRAIDHESWLSEERFFTHSVLPQEMFHHYWNNEKGFYHKDFVEHIRTKTSEDVQETIAKCLARCLSAGATKAERRFPVAELNACLKEAGLPHLSPDARELAWWAGLAAQHPYPDRPEAAWRVERVEWDAKCVDWVEAQITFVYTPSIGADRLGQGGGEVPTPTTALGL